MKNKYLYKFTVPKIEDVEVVETRKEGDQEIKITKKEKKIVNKSYGLLHPKRSTLEEGEMFYAARVSENIKNGILPTSILIKKFDENLTKPKKQNVAGSALAISPTLASASVQGANLNPILLYMQSVGASVQVRGKHKPRRTKQGSLSKNHAYARGNASLPANATMPQGRAAVRFPCHGNRRCRAGARAP